MIDITVKVRSMSRCSYYDVIAMDRPTTSNTSCTIIHVYVSLFQLIKNDSVS